MTLRAVTKGRRITGPMALLLLALPALAAAQPVFEPATGPYPAVPVSGLAPEPEPNPWSISGSVGAGTSYGRSYLLVGARLSRALALGLSLDLEGQYWVGGSPAIGKVAPGLTWASPSGLYLGTYYARWLVGSGYPDQDAVGARAGLVVARTGTATVTAGMAYERALDCRSSCESWWPEAGVGIRF